MEKEHKGYLPLPLYLQMATSYPARRSASPSQNKGLGSLCKYNHSGTTSSVKDHLPLPAAGLPAHGCQSSDLGTQNHVSSFTLEPAGVPRYL